MSNVLGHLDGGPKTVQEVADETIHSYSVIHNVLEKAREQDLVGRQPRVEKNTHGDLPNEYYLLEGRDE
jgi:hypothetical protein